MLTYLDMLAKVVFGESIDFFESKLPWMENIVILGKVLLY